MEPGGLQKEKGLMSAKLISTLLEIGVKACSKVQNSRYVQLIS